uniref:Uncharacterized protein n=1 Tax=Glossina pallidipes TaxID=7398 RepID=A0A1B0ADL6_GLOPL
MHNILGFSCKAVLCPCPFKEAEAASFNSGNKRLQALSESADVSAPGIRRRNAGDKRKSRGFEEGDLALDEWGDLLVKNLLTTYIIRIPNENMLSSKIAVQNHRHTSMILKEGVTSSEDDIPNSSVKKQTYSLRRKAGSNVNKL